MRGFLASIIPTASMERLMTTRLTTNIGLDWLDDATNTISKSPERLLNDFFDRVQSACNASDVKFEFWDDE